MTKRLLLLGGGYEQLNALRVAKELGAYVIVFDGQARAACMFEADEFYEIDIKNEQELITAAKKAKAEALFVHAAELAVEGAKVAAALGVPGISEDVAEAGTDKAIRSSLLREIGVSIPDFQSLGRMDDWENWRKAAGDLTFPIIAKPTRLAGAKGVELIYDFPTLERYFQRKGELAQQDFVIEEYVEGLQLSTEAVVVGGKVQCLSIALRHYDTTKSLLPYQIEDGHSMPWEGQKKYEKDIQTVTLMAAKAIGLQDGVLKGDLVLKEDGSFVVLEMAVRTSGGRFCDTVVPLSSGLNILYPLLKLSLGVAIEESDFRAGLTIGVSQRFVLVPEGTRLKKNKCIERILLQRDVIGSWFREDLHSLEQAPAIKSHRDRLGYVICTGDDRLSADEKAQEVVKELLEAIVETDTL